LVDRLSWLNGLIGYIEFTNFLFNYFTKKRSAKLRKKIGIFDARKSINALSELLCDVSCFLMGAVRINMSATIH